MANWRQLQSIPIGSLLRLPDEEAGMLTDDPRAMRNKAAEFDVYLEKTDRKRAPCDKNTLHQLRKKLKLEDVKSLGQYEEQLPPGDVRPLGQYDEQLLPGDVRPLGQYEEQLLPHFDLINSSN